MVVADQLLTPATLLLFLLLLIVIGVWLQLAMLRIRLSSRLSHIEGRLDEQDHLLDLQSKGLSDVAAKNEKQEQTNDKENCFLFVKFALSDIGSLTCWQEASKMRVISIFVMIFNALR